MPACFSLHHDVSGYMRDEFSLAGTLVRNIEDFVRLCLTLTLVGQVPYTFMMSRILQRGIIELGTEQAATSSFFFLAEEQEQTPGRQQDDRKDGPLMNDDP